MIIVGLGNPGKEYENTLHNAGYTVVEKIAERLNKRINLIGCNSLLSVSERGGEKLVLAKPLTYMNLSGEAVKSLVAKYADKSLEKLIVIYDDIDLPRFAIRVRASGSAGTHNGMRSVVEKLGSTDFIRVRMGVGRPDGDLKDYVLSTFSKEDKARFDETASFAADRIIDYLASGDFNKFLRETNTTKFCCVTTD